MSKEITVVYQDCVLCGVKGKQTIAEYAQKGITLRKVGFATEEGRELCFQAVNLGIKGMPFYTDGKIFASSIDELLSAGMENKPKAKNKNVRKEKKHGAISKAKR